MVCFPCRGTLLESEKLGDTVTPHVQSPSGPFRTCGPCPAPWLAQSLPVEDVAAAILELQLVRRRVWGTTDSRQLLFGGGSPRHTELDHRSREPEQSDWKWWASAPGVLVYEHNRKKRAVESFLFRFLRLYSGAIVTMMVMMIMIWRREERYKMVWIDYLDGYSADAFNAKGCVCGSSCCLRAADVFRIGSARLGSVSQCSSYPIWRPRRASPPAPTENRQANRRPLRSRRPRRRSILPVGLTGPEYSPSP